MKRILLLFPLLFAISGVAQTKRSFVCEQFSLSYPSSYKEVAINNAPHMKLKLQDNQRLFTASCWFKDYPSNVSIWDKEIYDTYLNMPLQNGNLVSVERSSVKIKDGVQRCLRIKTNLYVKGWQGHSVTFLMLNKGYLYTFCFYSDGRYNESSSTYYEENFLNGLSLINKKELETDQTFYNILLETIKGLNAQCPFQSDDCTIYRNILLTGKTISIKITIDDSCIDYISDNDYDNFKNTLTNNFAKALTPLFINYLDEQKYRFVYIFYDEEDNLLKIETIDAKDMNR